MTTKTWYIPIIPLDQPTTLLRHLCINSPFKLRRGLGFVPTSHFSLSVEKIYYNFLQQYYCTCTTHSIPLIVLILFTYYILVLFFVYMPATLCGTKFVCLLLWYIYTFSLILFSEKTTAAANNTRTRLLRTHTNKLLLLMILVPDITYTPAINTGTSIF